MTTQAGFNIGNASRIVSASSIIRGMSGKVEGKNAPQSFYIPSGYHGISFALKTLTCRFMIYREVGERSGVEFLCYGIQVLHILD